MEGKITLMEIQDLKAALDQLQMAIRDLAPVLFTHYSSMTMVGFSPEQAFALTRDFHSAYFVDRARWDCDWDSE